MADNLVSVELSRDQALVLFGWLARHNESTTVEDFADQAEQRVLWDLESILEQRLVASIDGAYETLLAEARARVRDPAG